MSFETEKTSILLKQPSFSLVMIIIIIIINLLLSVYLYSALSLLNP